MTAIAALPAIGSIEAAGPNGRPGLVVGARTLGQPQDGKQLVAITVKQVATGADCADCDKTDPLAAPPPGSFAAAAGRAEGPEPGARGYEDLSAGEREVVDRLRQRDQQVKQEEKAHQAVAGDAGGPISYTYQRGPDGKLYAVGGSVPISARILSGDPAEARELGGRLAAAAHAATNPSGADLAAARQGYGLQAEANAMESQDRRGAGGVEPGEKARGSAYDLAV